MNFKWWRQETIFRISGMTILPFQWFLVPFHRVRIFHFDWFVYICNINFTRQLEGRKQTRNWQVSRWTKASQRRSIWKKRRTKQTYVGGNLNRNNLISIVSNIKMQMRIYVYIRIIHYITQYFLIGHFTNITLTSVMLKSIVAVVSLCGKWVIVDTPFTKRNQRTHIGISSTNISKK